MVGKKVYSLAIGKCIRAYKVGHSTAKKSTPNDYLANPIGTHANSNQKSAFSEPNIPVNFEF